MSANEADLQTVKYRPSRDVTAAVAAVDAPKSMTSTMPIPVDAILDALQEPRHAALDIRLPEHTAPWRVALADAELLVGRGEDCELCLPLESVSRSHACIRFENEEYVVEDLNSTNGTFVNNVRVRQCTLRHNDQIRVGEALILFTQQRRS